MRSGCCCCFKISVVWSLVVITVLFTLALVLKCALISMLRLQYSKLRSSGEGRNVRLLDAPQGPSVFEIRPAERCQKVRPEDRTEESQTNGNMVSASVDAHAIARMPHITITEFSSSLVLPTLPSMLKCAHIWTHISCRLVRHERSWAALMCRTASGTRNGGPHWALP